jgi:twitching motility protein PilI
MQLMTPGQALKRPFIGVEVVEKKSEQDLQKVTESYHAFRIGDIGLLIPQNIISEVADKLAYCQLPNTRAVLFGMANLRGKIIPLFDLHELFSFAIPGGVKRKVLIIGSGENAVAVMISELPQRIVVSAEQRLHNVPPMPEVLKPYLKSCYQKDGVWLDIDYHGFFTSLGNQLQ